VAHTSNVSQVTPLSRNSVVHTSDVSQVTPLSRNSVAHTSDVSQVTPLSRNSVAHTSEKSTTIDKFQSRKRRNEPTGDNFQARLLIV
jgi:hypothetical protein